MTKQQLFTKAVNIALQEILWLVVYLYVYGAMVYCVWVQQYQLAVLCLIATELMEIGKRLKNFMAAINGSTITHSNLQ